jgi:transcriptional regulator with XRE-family HTH domain
MTPGQRGSCLDFEADWVDVRGMPSIGDVVAANVRAERARARLTQRQLAERLGWAVTTLADLEAGRRRPAVDDLPRLCEAFGVRLVDLLARADAEDLRRLGLDG